MAVCIDNQGDTKFKKCVCYPPVMMSTEVHIHCLSKAVHSNHVTVKCSLVHAYAVSCKSSQGAMD